MKKAAVVIPYYHNDLSVTEQISLMQCCLVLNKYDIILVAPESLEIHTDREFIVKRVPDKWLADIEGYNQLMAQKFFYEMFLGYEYILIYQLDAYVFCDELLRFCNMGYDYIGAPWLRGTKFFHGNEALIFVGNGGFSLRNLPCRLPCGGHLSCLRELLAASGIRNPLRQRIPFIQSKFLFKLRLFHS